MTLYTKLENKTYTADSPSFAWKTEAGNIVTSKKLIDKLNEKAAADSEGRREQTPKTN